jgi:hypothetical protein
MRKGHLAKNLDQNQEAIVLLHQLDTIEVHGDQIVLKPEPQALR